MKEFGPRGRGCIPGAPPLDLPMLSWGDPNFRGGSVIGSFALGPIFGALWPFSPFSVMAKTNFAFPLALRKLADPNFREVDYWKFCSRMCFWGATAIFPFSVLADTNFPFPSTVGKPETQTLGGLVIGSFTLGHIFGEQRPFFPFSLMEYTNFEFLTALGQLETQTLGGIGNLRFCSRMHFWGAMAIFPIFLNGRHQF